VGRLLNQGSKKRGRRKKDRGSRRKHGQEKRLHSHQGKGKLLQITSEGGGMKIYYTGRRGKLKRSDTFGSTRKKGEVPSLRKGKKFCDALRGGRGKGGGQVEWFSKRQKKNRKGPHCSTPKKTSSCQGFFWGSKGWGLPRGGGGKNCRGGGD